MERNQLSEAEATSRVNLQMDIEQKRKLADWVIDNSSTLQHTEQQVIALIQRLQVL
jgi:dephospho-CoA kinase